MQNIQARAAKHVQQMLQNMQTGAANHVPHMLQTNRTKLQNMFNKCCKKTFRPVLQSMFNKCCKTFRPVLQSMFNKCCKTFRPLRAMMQQWMLKGTSKEILNMHTANHPCSRHCKAFHTHPTLPWELCSSLVFFSTDFKFFAEPEPCSTYIGEVRVLHEIDLCLRQSLKHVWEATTTWNMELMHVIYFPQRSLHAWHPDHTRGSLKYN